MMDRVPAGDSAAGTGRGARGRSRAGLGGEGAVNVQVGAMS
ncbi:hypothetical protein SSAG_03809 [Streptomyces sp. Mg1]|nr:hypothetical protein SSAG_03809 [Streptomyces sp. Mg1]